MIDRVALVKTEDRAQGIRRALDLLAVNPVQGKRILLKPNFKTADPAPASTDPDVLRAIADWLRLSGFTSCQVV
jgi:uncharacterized protein (DUF362 family)